MSRDRSLVTRGRSVAEYPLLHGPRLCAKPPTHTPHHTPATTPTTPPTLQQHRHQQRRNVHTHATTAEGRPGQHRTTGWTEARGQQTQANDPGNNQHNPQYANYRAPLMRKQHIPPHSAQPQHTNDWAPQTRKRHQQEHRPRRPTERSNWTQHAEGRTGDCPGPVKEHQPDGMSRMGGRTPPSLNCGDAYKGELAPVPNHSRTSEGQYTIKQHATTPRTDWDMWASRNKWPKPPTPSIPTPTRSPLEPGSSSSRGRRGQGATNPIPLPLPRPLLYPLPTTTRSPATQCPPGQKE